MLLEIEWQTFSLFQIIDLDQGHFQIIVEEDQSWPKLIANRGILRHPLFSLDFEVLDVPVGTIPVNSRCSRLRVS
jgi:hypothetical protein